MQQSPAVQVPPGPHECPHAPQLFTSLVVSTHASNAGPPSKFELIWHTAVVPGAQQAS